MIMKHPDRTLMFQEARDAAKAVENLLRQNEDVLNRVATRLRTHPPAVVMTCARGSSDNAATYGKYLIETRLGIPTASMGLSVTSIYDAPVAIPNSLCLAISQSGRSPDLLAAVAAYKRGGAFVLALVNDAESPLAALADEVIALSAGGEHSVAATKSFIASLAAVAALVAAWTGDRALQAALDVLPEALRAAFDQDWPEGLDTLTRARNLFVLGRGLSLGIAQEAALKLKETCALHAEAFSAAEVRHGPMTIVGKGFPVLAFATSDAAGEGVRATSAEFGERLAHTLVMETPAPTDIALEPILMIQRFYRLANALSVARGLDPDAPIYLKKVTQTL